MVTMRKSRLLPSSVVVVTGLTVLTKVFDACPKLFSSAFSVAGLQFEEDHHPFVTLSAN